MSVAIKLSLSLLLFICWKACKQKTGLICMYVMYVSARVFVCAYVCECVHVCVCMHMIACGCKFVSHYRLFHIS